MVAFLNIAPHPSRAGTVEDFNKAVREQGAREFAVWQAAGCPADQRAVTNDGVVTLRTLHPASTRFQHVFK